jgi:Putative metal-binding motif
MSYTVKKRGPIMMRRLRLQLVLLAGVTCAAAAPARAQSLRPNIMFLFDTSGSMHEDSNLVDRADGTTVCPQSTTSRIYSLKSGIRQALQQVGTDEANFGLMSFPQTVQNAYTTLTANQCTNTGQSPIGHYVAAPAQTMTIPNRIATAYHNASTYPAGCLMTTNNLASQTTYDTWFTSGASQVFEVGVTSAAPGTMPTAAQFDPSGAAQMAAIYKWIDNNEAPASSGAVTDPELHPKDDTPLGRSLFYANLYFQNEIVPNDPKGSCRHNVMVVVTDGDDTCDDATAPDSTFKLSDCSGGGNYDVYNPVSQACLLNKLGVKVYVITDTTADNLNDTIAAAGGTGASIRVSLNDANAAKGAIVGIIAQNVPPVEVCNGKDDNCNGLIDEGVSNACLTCGSPGNTNPNCGTFSMSANDPNDPDNLLGTAAHHCAVEICNCLDDNCNGLIDEGLPPNACGKGCGCPVPAEICNGLDDNCDGLVDNGNWPTGPVGAKCNNGLIGACNRNGLLVCNASGTDTTCDAPTVTPQPEVCNGIDDNCNGQIDEGTLPGVGEACGNGLGACQAGTIQCVAGKLVCNVVSTPKPEVCNGIDDNCDGIIDNGNFPETGQPCLCPGLTQAEVGVGICKAGKLACAGALGFVCTGCVLPAAGEICNGQDNNCDGKPDTTGNCPNGFGCKDGACTLQCGTGEFPCPVGYKCVSNYCIPQRCATVTCLSGQHCDETSGLCVDDCAGVSCTLPQTCVQGRCVDCNQLGCDTGKICVGGVCQTDQCLGITCGTNQYCASGKCIDLCEPGKCGNNQTCVAGACQTDPCATVTCDQNYFCNPASGACLPNPCLSLQCPIGQRCVPSTGGCETDPCSTINCPSQCWHCGITNDGKGTCLLNNSCQPVQTQVGQRGGGESGCSYAAGDGGRASSWVGLLLALGLVVGRRAGRRSRRR